MFFNSLNFAIFLPVVFLIYWFLTNKNLIFQNILLLISSYFFYACWDWRFMFLLIFSTVLDYITAIKISKNKLKRTRAFWLWLSIIINLGFLCTFKYYNFFAESFSILLENMGLKVHLSTLQIILPVGISFYTFHGLSYIIDVYKGRINCENNFINYSVFVCFFPLLVAGPIERATHLLPQIKRERTFTYSTAINGLRQILWGLVKKVVIADSCAEYANQIFNNATDYNGATLFFGAIFFTFQIYGDFSGYSDIALGTARLFGLELLQNFAYPYFSRDIAEFWRRWHISLSSWFKDYLYIPLGGSKGGNWTRIRNTFIIFIVSGFWHGANWTFIFWGLLNAVYILPSIVLRSNRSNIEIVAKGSLMPTFRELIQIKGTFLLTVIAWIFFRATSIKGAFSYINEMVTGLARRDSFIQAYNYFYYEIGYFIPIIIIIFFLIEWLGREDSFAIEKLGLKWNITFRYAFYFSLIFLIFWFSGKEQPFIYFQF